MELEFFTRKFRGPRKWGRRNALTARQHVVKPHETEAMTRTIKWRKLTVTCSKRVSHRQRDRIAPEISRG